MSVTSHAQATVPALIGLSVVDAQQLALRARVIAVGTDQDASPPPGAVVTEQHPKAGLRVNAGDPVTIWVRTDPHGTDDDDEGGGGGGGGVPSPSGPTPRSPAGTK